MRPEIKIVRDFANKTITATLIGPDTGEDTPIPPPRWTAEERDGYAEEWKASPPAWSACATEWGVESAVAKAVRWFRGAPTDDEGNTYFGIYHETQMDAVYAVAMRLVFLLMDNKDNGITKHLFLPTKPMSPAPGPIMRSVGG
jgi:hypothetical protein